VTSVAFNADGRRVLSGSRDETLQLWDVSDGQCLSTFEGRRGWVRQAAFSPDGLTAVSVDEAMMKVWYVGKADPPKAKPAQ